MAQTAKIADQTNPGTYAKPYDEQKADFWERVDKFHKENAKKFELPKMDNTITWNTYVLNKTVFEHYVIVFVQSHIDNISGIIVHLTHKKDESAVSNKFKVTLTFNIMNPFDWKKEWKAYYIGDINKSMHEIFDNSYDILFDMGAYTLFENNCQKYVQLLAKRLGAPKDIPVGSEQIVKGVTMVSAFTLAIPVIVDYVKGKF